MKDLEKYVNENLKSFDDEEPGEGHLERFRMKLEQKDEVISVFKRSGIAIKIAAVILVFLTAGVFLFDESIHGLKHLIYGQTAAATIPSDVDEALQYYSAQANQGMEKISRLAGSVQEGHRLTEMVQQDLNSLNANSDELRKSFKENPNDERIKAALIRNEQMKKTIVDNVVMKMMKDGK